MADDAFSQTLKKQEESIAATNAAAKEAAKAALVIIEQIERTRRAVLEKLKEVQSDVDSVNETINEHQIFSSRVIFLEHSSRLEIQSLFAKWILKDNPKITEDLQLELCDSIDSSVSKHLDGQLNSVRKNYETDISKISESNILAKQIQETLNKRNELEVLLQKNKKPLSSIQTWNKVKRFAGFELLIAFFYFFLAFCIPGVISVTDRAAFVLLLSGLFFVVTRSIAIKKQKPLYQELGELVPAIESKLGYILEKPLTQDIVDKEIKENSDLKLKSSNELKKQIDLIENLKASLKNQIYNDVVKNKVDDIWSIGIKDSGADDKIKSVNQMDNFRVCWSRLITQFPTKFTDGISVTEHIGKQLLELIESEANNAVPKIFNETFGKLDSIWFK